MTTLKKTLLLITCLTLGCSTLLAQQNSPKFPILLTQKLQTPIKAIVVGNDFDITVTTDTADYIHIVTHGTIEEVDSMQFPDTKLQLKNDGTLLVFENGFPFHDDITVHTTSADINIVAKGDAKIKLASTDNTTIRLNRISMSAENDAIIIASSGIKAEEANLDVRGYGWIRYDSIDAPRVNKRLYGNGRITSAGHVTDESPISLLTIDHEQFPLFSDWAFGTSTIAQAYGDANTATNFAWGKALSFNYSFRYAFWHKKHWDISAGLGIYSHSFVAENAYLDLTTDPSTGTTNLVATDASSLFAQEESSNGSIIWSSSFFANYIYFPLRLEWRNRSDYKGLSFSAELQPGINFTRRSSFLMRHGVYQNTHKHATTRLEDFGKYMNPFMLGTRLTVGWQKISLYVEGSLTPLLRARQSGNSRSVGEKMYPLAYGICFTL